MHQGNDSEHFGEGSIMMDPSYYGQDMCSTDGLLPHGGWSANPVGDNGDKTEYVVDSHYVVSESELDDPEAERGQRQYQSSVGAGTYGDGDRNYYFPHRPIEVMVGPRGDQQATMRRVKQRASREHYMFVIRSPEGKQYKVDSLIGFCKDKNLKIDPFYKMSRGVQHTYKGWTCKRIDRLDPREVESLENDDTLEAVVTKGRDAPYQPGSRSRRSKGPEQRPAFRKGMRFSHVAVSPDGTRKYKIESLANFCCIFDIVLDSAYKAAQGRTAKTKGWHIRKATDEEQDQLARDSTYILIERNFAAYKEVLHREEEKRQTIVYTYLVTTPEGKVYKTPKLSYCAERLGVTYSFLKGLSRKPRTIKKRKREGSFFEVTAEDEQKSGRWNVTRIEPKGTKGGGKEGNGQRDWKRIGYCHYMCAFVK